jgi:hypothetical protein
LCLHSKNKKSYYKNLQGSRKTWLGARHAMPESIGGYKVIDYYLHLSKVGSLQISFENRKFADFKNVLALRTFSTVNVVICEFAICGRNLSLRFPICRPIFADFCNSANTVDRFFLYKYMLKMLKLKSELKKNMRPSFRLLKKVKTGRIYTTLEMLQILL